MKGAPWFKFYPSDFLGGVAELSSEERGSYITLLCVQWQGGSLPSEHDRLERLAGGKVSDLVRSKFYACSDGRLRNDRLESHREEATERSRAASIALANRKWRPIKPQSEDQSTDQSESNRPIEEKPIETQSTDQSEVRGQRSEARCHIPEVKDQKEEARPMPPPPPKNRKRIVHKVESMPEGLGELLKPFNDWLEARKTPATQGAVDIAFQRLKSWGVDKSRFILNECIVGRWDGLNDYGRYEKAGPITPKAHMTRDEKREYDIRILKQRQGES